VKKTETDTTEVVEAEDEIEGTADSDESESEEEIDMSGNALAQSVRWAGELEQETAARGNESDNSGAAAPTQSLMRSNFGVAPSRLIEEMNSNVTVRPGFAADMHYMHQLHEINNSELVALELSLVTAGFGTEFGTEDLKVLNYHEGNQVYLFMMELITSVVVMTYQVELNMNKLSSIDVHKILIY
jgi:hypothetical protein